MPPTQWRSPLGVASEAKGSVHSRERRRAGEAVHPRNLCGPYLRRVADILVEQPAKRVPHLLLNDGAAPKRDVELRAQAFPAGRPRRGCDATFVPISVSD